MFNAVDQKFSIIDKLGSFWYRTIEDDATLDVNKLTHVASLFDTDANVGKIVDYVLGSARTSRRDFVVKFGDKDVDGNALHVDNDLLITSIYLNSDSVLCRNYNFNSSYGCIQFNKDPRVLFPSMRLHVRSGVQRVPNILCFSLGLQHVYGDVSFIVDYCRNNQSPYQFYRATAQAAGLSVIKEECVVTKVLPQQIGASYMVSTGDRYDAWYPHTQLNVGDQLERGDIIGEDIIRMILPTDDDSALDDLTGASLGTSCPVGNIVVQNDDAVIYDDNDLFKPQYQASQETLDKYHAYIEYVTPATNPDAPEGRTQNALHHFRNVVAKNRCIIVVLAQDLPGDLSPEEAQVILDINKKAFSFIRVNAPMGSIVLYGLKANTSEL